MKALFVKLDPCCDCVFPDVQCRSEFDISRCNPTSSCVHIQMHIWGSVSYMTGTFLNNLARGVSVHPPLLGPMYRSTKVVDTVLDPRPKAKANYTMSHDTPLIEVLAEPSRLGEHLRCGTVRDVKPEFQVLRPTPYRVFPGTKDPMTLVAEHCGSACLANVAKRQTTNLIPPGRLGVSASGAQPTTVATVTSTYITVHPEPLPSACTPGTSSNLFSSISKLRDFLCQRNAASTRHLMSKWV